MVRVKYTSSNIFFDCCKFILCKEKLDEWLHKISNLKQETSVFRWTREIKRRVISQTYTIYGPVTWWNSTNTHQVLLAERHTQKKREFVQKRETFRRCIFTVRRSMLGKWIMFIGDHQLSRHLSQIHCDIIWWNRNKKEHSHASLILSKSER